MHRLHNFIVEHRNEDEPIFRDFYAVNAFENNEGVYGGEQDVCRDSNGDIMRGRRPTQCKLTCADVGRKWRDRHRNEISRQGNVRPNKNWYKINNQLFER